MLALYDIPLGRLMGCTVVRDCALRFGGRRRKKGGEMVNRLESSIKPDRMEILVIGDLRVVIGVKIDFQQFSGSSSRFIS